MTVSENFCRDLAYAARALRRNPAFAITAALSLALGIGITTAIFTLLNAVALRPLPYSDPDRLVWMTQVLKANSSDEVTISPDFLDWRQRNHTFTDLAAYNYISQTVTGLNEPMEVHAAKASAALLPLLGVKPVIGRSFFRQEDYRGPREHVAILSNEFWRQHFNRDPNIVGRPVVLSGQQFTIVGVLPRKFVFPGPSPVELLTPLGKNEAAELERNPNGPITIVFNVVGRLKPGITLAQAHADLSVIQSHLPPMAFHPRIAIKILPLRERLFGNAALATLVLLSAAVFLLFIACANVGNLLLIRLMQRDRELGIRAALGGSRARIVSQLLTEGLLLSGIACGAGMLLAYWLRRPLLALSPYRLAGLETLPFDTRVLWFALALAILTTLLFSLMPALRATQSSVSEALKSGGSSVGGGRRSVRVLSGIAVAEIATTLILSSGTGLMLQSFWKMRYLDLGFQADRLVVATLNVANMHERPRPQQLAFQQALLGRTAVLPGVELTALTDAHEVPPGDWHATNTFDIEGREQPVTSRHRPIARQQGVSAGYFNLMRIPLLDGRTFAESDAGNALPVAVVNRALVRLYCNAVNPLGLRIRVGGRTGIWYTIIGVVGDVKTSGLAASPEPAIYLAYSQLTSPSEAALIAVIMRTGLDPKTIAAEFRASLAKMDPHQPVARVESMDNRLNDSVSKPRFTAVLLALFASLAVALGAIGVYGVMSFRVRLQIRDIAVRQAVGAQPGDVMAHVLRQALGIVTPGVCFGLLGAGALNRLLSSMLYDVLPNDPLTLAAASIGVVLMAVLACSIPALRAASIDPLISLRQD